MKETEEKTIDDRIESIVLIFLSSAYLVGAFLIPMPVLKQQVGPDAFPKAIGFAMLALSLVYAFQQFRRRYSVWAATHSDSVRQSPKP